MNDREFLVHYAKVLLADCAARRHSRASRNFYWHQFAEAQQARREAAAMRETMQGEFAL